MIKKIVYTLSLLIPLCSVCLAQAETFKILSQITEHSKQLTEGEYRGHYYVPSTLDTIQWGYLPNRYAKHVLTVPSGSAVIFDTISHEGLLEDQGRDAERFFKSHGVKAEQILAEAKMISQSELKHDFSKDGPHIVTGPVAIQDAMPGDVLKVEVIKIEARVPYALISNRHTQGTSAGELSKTQARAHPTSEQAKSNGNVSVFTPIEKNNAGQYEAVMKTATGQAIRVPLKPFMGLMGVAVDSSKPVHSIASTYYGGDLDINDLGDGSSIYYPVQVPGALFYTGDGHFSQGDGKIALTALEGSTRATFKLTLLKVGRDKFPGKSLTQPIAETQEYWITLGLDADLKEAVKKSTREAVRFINQEYGIDESLAYAYLSVATDFEISQLHNKTKTINTKIRKADFKAFKSQSQHESQTLLQHFAETTPPTMPKADDIYSSASNTQATLQKVPHITSLALPQTQPENRAQHIPLPTIQAKPQALAKTVAQPQTSFKATQQTTAKPQATFKMTQQSIAKPTRWQRLKKSLNLR